MYQVEKLCYIQRNSPSASCSDKDSIGSFLSQEDFRKEGSLWKIPEIETESVISHLRAAAAKSLQSCPTLCDPIDSSPPGAAVPGILQARTLEWVAISFSNA